MNIIFLILAIILLLPDTYIVFSVLGKYSWWVKGLFLLPSAVYLVMILRLVFTGDHRPVMLNCFIGLTLCIVFPTLIFALISLLGKGIGLFLTHTQLIFNIIGMAAAVLWLIISGYGISVGWKRLTLERVHISSSKIPKSFNGYRIVQLTDFHIGTYCLSPATVDSVVKMVNSQNPDLIVFTGDLVNNSPGEAELFKNALSRLRANDGIYSVLGNHDYCLYREYDTPEGPAKALQHLMRIEKEMGWQLLRNSSIQIRHGNDCIALVGVDNAGSKMFPDKSDLPKAVRGLPKDEFKILLSHDPSHWRREVLPFSDIDLMLAGHTHAMQFKIGNWSPSKWSYHEWGGLYKEGDRQLYVSTGIGENVAFRFGAWPQIVVITLDSGSADRKH